MEETVIGLDIGASFTKIVLVNKDFRIIEYGVFPSGDPVKTALKALNYLFNIVDLESREKVRMILSTGGGSRFLGNELLNFPVRRINEIEAIGLGGLTLSGKRDCLVVSAGTGTALVVVQDCGGTIRHVGGTGVGGGTILGLSQRMLGILDFGILEEMAIRGDPSRVDLLISDLIGGPIGIMPADVTASNFGKIFGEASAEDIAAAIFNMVSQTITVVSAMAAKAYNLENDIVVTGMLAKSKLFSKIMQETAKLFSVRVSIPESCELAGAMGAITSYFRRATVK